MDYGTGYSSQFPNAYVEALKLIKETKGMDAALEWLAYKLGELHMELSVIRKERGKNGNIG